VAETSFHNYMNSEDLE